jgi:hypothetical protein
MASANLNLVRSIYAAWKLPQFQLGRVAGPGDRVRVADEPEPAAGRGWLE